MAAPLEGGALRIVVTVPWGERLGGAETLLQTVLDGVHESAHELELVFLQPGAWPRELREAGFRVEVLAAGRLREPWRWAATVIALARILRDRRPDLLLDWAAKTHLYGAPAALLAGMGGKVVWWQHLIADGHWVDRCATALPARAVLCCSAAAARAQAQLSPARPTYVVRAGAPVAGDDGVLPAAGDAGVSLAVGNDGVSPVARDNGGPPAQSRLPIGVPVVGLVGRLQPWKGQDRLLRAHALLRERGCELHTVLVGGDAYGFSSAYAASLPALVQRLGLADAVTLTGQVPDAGPYIERMDILVNASDPEPFGIVLLEAMARGVPVVAVDAGGPAEFIAPGDSGLLARSGEPEALADAIEPLLREPALRARLGGAGRERYLGEFTDRALRTRLFARLEEIAGSAAA
ncbi:MAG TPA: glycosyltransferase [Solirubrobacteraceae bacterium]|nr:glycosyltransferase [Solirubrobacteraceae bacterium]